MYKNANKVCSFYASDEHLVTMLTSYAKQTKDEKKEIITIFEKDLSCTGEKVCRKLNDNIMNIIDWKKTNINDLSIKLNKNLQGKTIIISGQNKYINSVNMLLENLNEDFEIINCFYIFQNEKKVQKIIEEHSKILTTQGIENIGKTLICNI